MSVITIKDTSRYEVSSYNHRIDNIAVNMILLINIYKRNNLVGHLNIILFGRVYIIGSRLTHIEYINLRNITGIVKIDG